MADLIVPAGPGGGPGGRFVDPEYLRNQAERLLRQAGAGKEVAWVTTVQIDGSWESAVAVRVSRPNSRWTWEVGATLKQGKGEPLAGGARIAVSF